MNIEIKKKDIQSATLEEISEFVKSNNQPVFRAKQIYDWLWKKGATRFDEMTNLSKELREKLQSCYTFNSIEISRQIVSKDKTIKVAFKLHDDKLIEGVLIPSKERVTACISSQTGCNLSCKFCASGTIKNVRNLTAGEIFSEVALLNQLSIKEFGQKLSNIVFMGIGEPLLNYNNVLEAIEKVTSKDGLDFSPSRITLSTVGVSKMIIKLADKKIKFNLAISLHTANQLKREHLIPYAKTDTLDDLADAIEYFHEKTGIRVTYEYLIIKDFNDSLNDAKELTQFCKISPCKINIIEYNPVDNATFKKSDDFTVSKFIEFLEGKNLIVNLRKSKGKDIAAACGQLVNKE